MAPTRRALKQQRKARTADVDVCAKKPTGQIKGRLNGLKVRDLVLIDVYESAKDVIRMPGLGAEEFSTIEDAIHFAEAVGSLFVIYPRQVSSLWLNSNTKTYVAGPKKGTSEEISDADVKAYQET